MEKIRSAFNRILWDEKKQLYRDGVPGQSHVSLAHYLPADVDKIFYSRQTNSLAVLYELMNGNKFDNGNDGSDLIKNFMTNSNLPDVQPYFMHFLFDAFAKAQLFETFGFIGLLQWKKIMQEHPTSWKESWNFGDYSHAWSGTPTYQLSSKVLGITPETPGFAIIHIHPCLGKLNWLKGNVPTPKGEIILEIHRTDNIVTMKIFLPFDSTAKLCIPVPKEKILFITEHGRLIWQQNKFFNIDSHIMISICNNHPNLCFLLQRGSYQFEISEIR
jgi:hypothetical protein